ncbi:hypothetical protein HDU86_002290 [Geranomyces michiganensis]|nr:hypothetical protein HDU86_002290 [Geranomyces michiganensis]
MEPTLNEVNVVHLRKDKDSKHAEEAQPSIKASADLEQRNSDQQISATHHEVRVGHALRVAGRHLWYIVQGLLFYVIVAMFPIAKLYDEGKTYAAMAAWWAECFVLGFFTFNHSSTFWTLSLLGEPFKLTDFRNVQTPIVVTAAVSLGIYIILGVSTGSNWPDKTPASPVWGGSTYLTVPSTVTYLLLPASLKSEPGFLKRFIWTSLVSANGFIFFFQTVVYYLLFTVVPENFRILIIIGFKLVTTAYSGFTVKLVHKVTDMNQMGDPIRDAAAYKFFIEACYEMYIFFTLHDIHGWGYYSIYLGMEMLILTFELWHDEESMFDWLVKPVKDFHKKMSHKYKPASEPRPLAQGNKSHYSVSAKAHKSSHAHNLPDAKAIAMSNAMLFVEGRKHFNARILHYCVSVQARIYGAVATTVLLPTWYWGPNHSFFIFNFSGDELWFSIGQIWLAVGVTLIHFVIARHVLWRMFAVDVLAAWIGFADLFSDYFWATYMTAPVFPAVQLPRQWSMVWWVQKLTTKGL